MATVGPGRAARLPRWAWGFLIAMGALLLLHGTLWFFQGPETALENISERAGVGPDAFQQGSPSAFDVITLVTRNTAIAEAAFGLVILFAAWNGYHHGARWAWQVTWVLVAALLALALSLLLIGGGAAAIAFFGIAAMVFAAQLIAARGVA